jgi:hypothetical protein
VVSVPDGRGSQRWPTNGHPGERSRVHIVRCMYLRMSSPVDCSTVRAAALKSRRPDGIITARVAKLKTTHSFGTKHVELTEAACLGYRRPGTRSVLLHVAPHWRPTSPEGRPRPGIGRYQPSSGLERAPIGATAASRWWRLPSAPVRSSARRPPPRHAARPLSEEATPTTPG